MNTTYLHLTEKYTEAVIVPGVCVCFLYTFFSPVLYLLGCHYYIFLLFLFCKHLLSSHFILTSGPEMDEIYSVMYVRQQWRII